MTTATKTKSVTYLTDRSNRVLIIEGEDYAYNHRGRPIQKFEPTKLVFRDYRCDVSLYDGPASKHEGKAVIQGEVQNMDYDELIPIIEGHRFYKRHFWPAGQGPREKHPTLLELAEMVKDASAEELRELLEQEQATHNRNDAIVLISQAALNGHEEPDKGYDEDPEAEPEAPEEPAEEPVDEPEEEEAEQDGDAEEVSDNLGDDVR